ncbi:hypothetical protein [Agarivorans sp. JK6]|uniref:hypothetical protein n=1 Tax=Agarivorans sp. JK6 TaxID=2997426 RepID=UPI003873AA1F
MSTIEPGVTAETKQCSCKGEEQLHNPKHSSSCQCNSHQSEDSKPEHSCGCRHEDHAATEELSQSLIDKLVASLADKNDYQAKLSCFKKHHPSIRIIECSEDDMAEREAFMSASYFDLFLMAKGTTCARLTNSVDLAIGVVIALHEE